MTVTRRLVILISVIACLVLIVMVGTTTMGIADAGAAEGERDTTH